MIPNSFSLSGIFWVALFRGRGFFYFFAPYWPSVRHIASFHVVFMAGAIVVSSIYRDAAIGMPMLPCRPAGLQAFAMRSPNVCLQSSRCASSRQLLPTCVNLKASPCWLVCLMLYWQRHIVVPRLTRAALIFQMSLFPMVSDSRHSHVQTELVAS